MSCNRYEHMLSPYIEGDLSPEDAAAVDAHVASCALCRESLAELRALEDALVARRDQVPASEPFARGVFAAVRAAKPARAVSPAFHRARVIMDAIFSVSGLAAVFSVIIGAMCFHYRDVVAAWTGRALSTSPSAGSSWFDRFLSTYAADMTMVFIVYSVATVLVVASGAWMTVRYLQDH